MTKNVVSCRCCALLHLHPSPCLVLTDALPAFRDYVFKRITLEMLFCLVGAEELLMSSFLPKPQKPVARISQLSLLIPRDVLASSAANLDINAISCSLRLLHVSGPHIFNSAPGGRRAQASLGLAPRCSV